ncbi:hypothetical protein [Clostridium beijerinckii]|uniref:Uncharacterized protein n=1 Tax=Clostridium beijerinckii TaxID=1520 RepID=A0A9Q5GE33_CLOBE|nr:hypothetical protein [Clostridium beijerinckii]AQS05923.1 hypothetical protein CLBIJ_33660 [Clostridium beijerinckii]MBA2887845.1 hypothetical protein [Clostridium beijerinckii]MBA2902580.1 hypothetical protein [Clostridium beijerinckii]MBA2912444.1 hypothetical protein [Clostridium beijerinckii]MBA9014474.1 hypothetical protein [Clostridium beijerinckii]
MFTFPKEVTNIFFSFIYGNLTNLFFYLNEEEWVSELDKGRIKIIKECKNAFYWYEMKFDYIAIRIILHISKEYKKTGKLPQRVSFIQ